MDKTQQQIAKVLLTTGTNEQKINVLLAGLPDAPFKEKLQEEITTLRHQVQELTPANETAKLVFRDKNEQLALRDLEIVKLREKANKLCDVLSSNNACFYQGFDSLRKAANTTFTPTHLNAHVEQEIKERIGEPVAWMNSINRMVINKTKKQQADYSLFDTPLYAVKEIEKCL